jgi:hypothetical protein
MSTVTTNMLESGLSNMLDLPLDVDVDVDEYSRVMRRIGVSGDDPDTLVSAFNSSI